MRYKVTAELEAESQIPGPFKVSWREYDIEIETDDKGAAKRLSIERPVTEYRKWTPRLRVSKSGSAKSPHEIHIPASPLFDEFRDLFQYIESVGSFWFGIRRLHWLTAKHEWLPDSSEERAELSLFSYSVRQDYPHGQLALPAQAIRGLLDAKEKLSYLTVPLAFFREGRTAFIELRYITAFFQFYLFLEGVYGQGKTKNAAVMKSMQMSTQVRAAAQDNLSLLRHARHGPPLQQFFKEENCDQSVDGVIAFLVKMRGNLHHYSIKSTKRKGHPLNQAEFESVAYLALSIVMHTVAVLITGRSID